jgi:hypothetical protein
MLSDRIEDAINTLIMQSGGVWSDDVKNLRTVIAEEIRKEKLEMLDEIKQWRKELFLSDWLPTSHPAPEANSLQKKYMNSEPKLNRRSVMSCLKYIVPIGVSVLAVVGLIAWLVMVITAWRK